MNPHQSSQTSNEHIRDSTLKQGEILDPKRFSEEENQLYQRVFCPKIKRKTLKLRSVRKKCAELVDSFYPITEVTYEAMKLRLIQLDRCSRQTILKYLGRPETRQIETVRHTIRTQNSERAKDHTFTHILPAKRGLVEVYGYASLVNKKGKLVFLLHHTYQTDLEKQFVSPPAPPQTRVSMNLHMKRLLLSLRMLLPMRKSMKQKFQHQKIFSRLITVLSVLTKTLFYSVM